MHWRPFLMTLITEFYCESLWYREIKSQNDLCPPDNGYRFIGISGCVHLGLHRLGVSQDLYPLITDSECSAYYITLLYSWGPNWLFCVKPEGTGFVLGSSTRAGKRELSSKLGNSSRSAGCRIVREPTGCGNHSSKSLFCKELVGD